MKQLLPNIRVLHWRYWPMEVLYLPLTLYVLFIGSLRTGKLFYFSATNPIVPLGGFASDSKYDILERVPNDYKPNTILITEQHTTKELLFCLEQSCIRFPIIVKPDLGEGGFLVKKITNEVDLIRYHESHLMNYLVQQFIVGPMEVSILVHNTTGALSISSITERTPLTLKGNGINTLKELILQDSTARFRLTNISNHSDLNMNHVYEKDEVLQPVSIGNWDYGANYVERKDLINNQLIEAMKKINEEIGLFNYARYDIKCKNNEELSKGNFKILEINGVKGEPIHIYDSHYSLYNAYKEIFKHWKYILKISKRNLSLGCRCATIKEGVKLLRHHHQAKKNALKRRVQNV